MPEQPDATSRQNHVITRLRRIEGQVRGIQRMLEEGRDCEGILTQLMAIRSGIEQVSLILLDRHVERCVQGLAQMDERSREELHRVLKLWTRLGPVPEEPGPPAS